VVFDSPVKVVVVARACARFESLRMRRIEKIVVFVGACWQKLWVGQVEAEEVVTTARLIVEGVVLCRKKSGRDV
jgi:hypothetical protein